MTIRQLTILLSLPVIGLTGAGLAQVPFFTAQATSVDPVIAYATDGTMLNVQKATVSADRKYVTMDMSPQLNSLQGIHNFTFQRPGLGFVGSATASGAATAAKPSAPSSNHLTPSIGSSPKAIAAAVTPPSVLDRPGMTLIFAAHP